ncbi:hypothetical protein [Sphaerotilus sp.]|uniref:hypothetical protein n=1 Tax=Sphaerotilus sp. TaxID=2093942 RepID=UPI002ACEF728|nr:hypothetical protein [Sphaerotilus sp.]MDZ7855170.1 hypothetical protein [Sphaerotilus sp.]
MFEGRLRDRDERTELLDSFLGTCEWTRVCFGWRPNLPDEADHQLVELVVVGAADFIVTPDFFVCLMQSTGIGCLGFLPGDAIVSYKPSCIRRV